MSAHSYQELPATMSDLATPASPGGQIGAGEEAEAVGRSFTLAGHGNEDALAEAMQVGRPRVGAEKGGKSPVVRGAIPVSEFEQFEHLRSKTGRAQSELVREAIHLLLAKYKQTS